MSESTEIIKCPINKWRQQDHYRAFVYRPYYYTYYDYPYYESKYISHNDKIYDPTLACTRKIKLNDGTLIEGFHNKPKSIFVMLCFIVTLFMIFYLSQKK